MTSEASDPGLLRVRWRPRAQVDRESIAIFLGVECGSPSMALSVMAQIDRAIERARRFPDACGRYRDETLEAKEYRTVVTNPYTVYYRFDEEFVTIYRILHQRQDISEYALIDFPEDA